MEILETKGRKMNKIKREEREDLHTFSDTTFFWCFSYGLCILHFIFINGVCLNFNLSYINSACSEGGPHSHICTISLYQV